MISRKKLVTLDEAVAGMALSQAVVDDRGGVLLPAATVLTEIMLKSLRRRGIEMLRVVNDDFSEADLKAERARREQRMASLFRKCDSNRACQALRQRVTEYRSGELE
jgi:hypothetical protein